MTETTTASAVPGDAAQTAIAIGGATLARDIVATILNELRNMPDHWSRLAESRQQQSLEAIKDRVKTAVDVCVAHLVRGTYPAVPATLEYVGNRKGISASLTIAKDALCRHELFDAQGQRVLVVIADPAKWSQGLDEIRAKSSQADLFDPAANYDPKVDTPGYRRDQDPLAPGKSWADIKASFAKPADPDAPPPSSDPAADGLALQMALQERLAAVGCLVSLGAVQSWSNAQVLAAGAWSDAYASDPTACTIERPEFLPAPTNKQDDAGDAT